MRVEVEPRSATVVPGYPTVLTVRVVNTGTVISGSSLRILGVDPRWVHLDQDQLSLFPDAAGVVVLTVTLPPGIPAGVRLLGVEVRELTPPMDRQVVEVELTVPAELGLKVDLDPVTTTGGHNATVGVLVANTGNSVLDIDLSGTDEEGQVKFIFSPDRATLAPGDRTLAAAELKAKRPLLGSPKIRSFKVLVGPAQPPVGAFGTWVQKPRLTRGAIALIGLLLVVSVFALVLTFSLSRVVNKSSTDRDLALQVAQANQAGIGGGGSGSIKGTVTLLTTGAPVDGVTVEIFNAANSAQPLASAATNGTGGYQFQGLNVGNYKIRFSGAGFTQLWYPTSLTADNATPISLAAAQELGGVDARLGGVPASLSGLVVGADPSGAMVSLAVPAAGQATATPAAGGATVSGTPGAAAAPGASNTPAIVTTQTLDASGAFTLAQIPSPSTYVLTVAKTGFATTTQQVDLGSGEQRKGIVITLRQGDGSISGSVSTSSGPLGGATVSASDGHTTVSTVSISQGTIGGFTLSNLPTPSTFTVTVSAAGFATQTLTLTLAAAQQLTGVVVTLAPGVGSISGHAKVAMGSPAVITPAGGVTVTVTNGQLSLQTVTLSTGDVGSYQVNGLAVPSTYTVTFSRSDLASQTKAVPLDAVGSATAANIDATLTSATAILSGIVRENDAGVNPPVCPAPDGHCPVGEVRVSLSSGTTSYQTTSSSAAPVGKYEFDNVQPGTYTLSFTRPGGLPTSTILTLTAGVSTPFDPLLARAASITGIVVDSSASPMPRQGVEVRLYRADRFPAGEFQSQLTNSDGRYTFVNLEAPQSYVLAFAFPPGTPGQLTVERELHLSEQLIICGPLNPYNENPCPPIQVVTG